MSRVGKRPIPIPGGVEVRAEQRVVHAKGPRGENAFTLPARVEVEINEGTLHVVADHEGDPRARALMGTVQACLNNLVTGVHEGFTRRLRLVGVGYRGQLQGQELELQLGFSHPVRVTLPEGVTAQMEGNNAIVLSSHDKVLLGQTAASIRALRPPEPYQGKGVSYENERIRRKAGKTGKR